MGKTAIGVGLLFVAILAGCSKPEDKFVGHWDGKLEVTQSFIDAFAPGLSPDQQNLLRAELAKSSADLELRQDGSYTFATNVVGTQTSVSGTWSYGEEANRITLLGMTLSEVDRNEARAAGATEEDVNAGQSKIKILDVGSDGESMSLAETRSGVTLTIRFARG